MNIYGECEDQFSGVKELFNELHSTDREVGSSFAVYKDGKPIVDIWGGHSNSNKETVWEKNTLATVWSTTFLIGHVSTSFHFKCVFHFICK